MYIQQTFAYDLSISSVTSAGPFSVSVFPTEPGIVCVSTSRLILKLPIDIIDKVPICWIVIAVIGLFSFFYLKA